MKEKVQNHKLGDIDVLSPMPIEVDSSLTDLVGNILRTYILEDDVNEAQLEILIDIGQLLCLNIENVKVDVFEKGLYQSWQADIASDLNDHAFNNSDVYEHLSYLRMDVTKSQPWLLFIIIVICQSRAVEANKIELDLPYLMRFCENIVSTLFSDVSAAKAV